MSGTKQQGIDLEPNTQPLADGTNALQFGHSPTFSLNSSVQNTPKGPKGNPGIYLGKRQIRFVYDGVMHTGIFHVIKAIEGTWLSAATRKFGWGKRYGPEDGYGAYVEGIVRNEDGTYIWDASADHIKPGELFAIELYEPATPGKKRKRIDGKPTLTPEQEEQLEPEDPTIELSTIIGLGVDIASQISDVVGVIATPYAIFSGMASAARAGSSNESMAGIRAQCYAITAFTWMEHEKTRLPVSKVFNNVLPGLVKGIEKSWRENWDETKALLTQRFEDTYVKIYQDVVKKNGNPPSEMQLRKHIMKKAQKKHGTPAQHCDKLLVSAAEYWKNLIQPQERQIWDYHRKTKYPN